MTAAEACRFTGSVLSGKSRRAWFVDLRSGDIYWAGRNQLLAIPDLPLPILDVRDDMVIVEYCADPRIVPLGDSIVTPSVLPADLAALAQPATTPVQRRNQSIPETNQLQPETANYESETAPAAFPQPNSNPSTDRSNLPVPASTPAFRAVPSALPRPSTSVLR